jgi:quercetin dioxygenase-like cupin family protein
MTNRACRKSMKGPCTRSARPSRLNNRECERWGYLRVRYALGLNFEGSVSPGPERDGCHLLSLQGSGGPPESTDPWQLSVQFAWPQTPGDDGFSSQIEVGAMLRGSFCSGKISTLTDQGGTGQAWMLGLEFTVHDSAGWFAGTQGTIRLDGTATIQGFRLTANLELDAPEDAWFPPNGGLLSRIEEASGASHVAAAAATSRGPSRQKVEGEIEMTQEKQRRHNPPGVTTGSPERPAEQMAAPVMPFDLAAELEGLHSERSWKAGERNAKTLVSEPDFRVVLIAMHAGTRLRQHEADALLTMQTVEGHLRVQLPDGAVDLPATHLLALERNVSHEVEAIEDSALLLTLAWPAAGAGRH